MLPSNTNDTRRQEHHAIGSINRQAANADGVDDREEGTGDSYTEGKRTNGEGGEPGMSCEQAPRLPHIPRTCLKKRQAPLIPVNLLDLIDAAEGPPRGGQGRLTRQSAAKILVRQGVEVCLDFVAQLPVAPPAEQQVGEPGQPHPDSGHDSCPRRRLSMATVRPHRSVSRANRFRPALVRA
jgi:hypothetical protein